MTDLFARRLARKGWSVAGNGCWVSGGSHNGQGYSSITVGGKTYKTHRLAYETWVGPIPDGLLIRHKCDNPPCINPDHLVPGTKKENMTDALERGGRGSLLNYTMAEEIRSEYKEGVLTQSMLAEAYGVSVMTVSDVIRGKSWVKIDRPDAD